MGGMRGRRFSSVAELPRPRPQEEHVQDFQRELAELDEDVLGSMEIRKQDAVERALEHSRDDLPRLKRQASASKHAWQHASAKLAFIGALVPASSDSGRTAVGDLRAGALHAEAAALQTQLVHLTAQCKADKELLTGEAVQGEVEELNRAVVAAFEAYRQQRPQVDGALREARRLADAAGRPQEDLPPLPDGLPEEECRMLLARAEEEADLLELQYAQDQAACGQLQGELEGGAQQLEVLQSRVAELAQQQEAHGAHDARFVTAAAKARQLLELQSQLSGMAVEVDEDVIIAHLSTYQGNLVHRHRLVLQQPEDDEESGAPLSAVLSPATVPIDDIIAAAAPGWGGMSSLVLQTHQRLQRRVAMLDMPTAIQA